MIQGKLYTLEQLQQAIHSARVYANWDGQMAQPVTPEMVPVWLERNSSFVTKGNTISLIHPADLLTSLSDAFWANQSKVNSLWLPQPSFEHNFNLRQSFRDGEVQVIQVKQSNTIAETIKKAVGWAKENGYELLGPEIQMVLQEECGNREDLTASLPNDLSETLTTSNVLAIGGVFCLSDNHFFVISSRIENETLQFYEHNLQSRVGENNCFFARKL